MADSFIGEIRILPYTFAPDQWAYCNGAAVSRQQNAALFAVIGTIYGSTSSTTFNLPNLQGCAPMGMGQGPGLTSRSLGPKSVGEISVTLVDQRQLPSHSHTLTEQATTVLTDIIANPNGAWLSHGEVEITPPTGFATYAAYSQSAVVAFREPALSPAGGGGAHGNMQPYLGMNFCISLFGEFPMRP